MFFLFQLKLIYLIFSHKPYPINMADNHKIFALDLRNATIENLENWFITTDYITSKTTKDYIRHCITTWKDNKDPIQMKYIINDMAFGTVNKNNFPAIQIDDWFSNEFVQHCIPIQIKEVDLYRPAIIDWIFNTHTSRSNIAFELKKLQKYNIDFDIMVFPHFTSCVTCIEVEELGFNLKHIFIPENQKFKFFIDEFHKYYFVDNNENRIQLTKIYILEKYILGYSFRMVNEPYEHFLWNIHLDDLLHKIIPFKFNEIKKLTIDDVLDKINLVGYDYLSDIEKETLNKI